MVDTLLLSRGCVAVLASSLDYLAAIEQGFKDLAKRRYSLPPVSHIPCRRGGVHVKCARSAGEPPRVVVKINANFPQNETQGLPTIQGFIALLDAESGAILALLDSIELTARRTAAATALAARYCARSNSSILAVVGCGAQARYHVDALLDVMPLCRVKYCEPRQEAAADFRRYLESRNLEGSHEANPSVAARGADIVVTLTTSTRALLHVSDIDEGTFVAGVGADNPSKHELAPDLLQQSRVVVDLLTQASVMGDLHHAIDQGVMTATEVHAELADVVAGNSPGRTSAADRFVFDSTGVAVQDLVAAEMIHARARKAGVGTVMRFDDVEFALREQSMALSGN